MTESPSEHPDAGLLAAYLDRNLSGAEREKVATHMAACVRCRSHLADVSRVSRASRRERSLVMEVLGVAAIAAAVLIAALPGRDSKPSTDMPFRSSAAAVQRMTLEGQVLQPQPGHSELRLMWSSAGKGSQYRVSITNEAGEVVWETGTVDTTVSVPATVPIHAGGEFQWVVDALLPDGNTATTGVKLLPPRL